ncbi:hypothetical protein [Flavihumibacter petaseus]|uniref:Uncharacterized protein n=1 Tax=Flavihumibacter petaseus NBRC 106054 TaxID=1220578 RepID=A0A0E9N3Z7_9BACT|nr:hypothetical protein [Flavihumibacter petaseus]GAO44090.1 hypothetical protein FPE01S_03_01300 [Flavihumibacter petaseus NBRC 106054]
MPLYTLVGLPVPVGYVSATPAEINSTGQIAGTCHHYYGTTKAMAWDAAGYTLIGPPGFYSHASGLNSKQLLTGNYVDDKHIAHPFVWDSATGTLTLLNLPPQNSNSGGAIVNAINDNNQMAGYAEQLSGSPSLLDLFWSGLNSNPVGSANQIVDSWAVGINNNGIIIGSIYNSTGFQGFIEDSATQIKTLIANCNGCIAITDHPKPQVLIYKNTNKYKSYMFDTLNNKTSDLNVPGDDSYAYDINNHGVIAGESANDGAVTWKGLVKVKLNSPLISDAQAKGWDLTTALSINDQGQIVGTGIVNGNESPWMLQPNPKLVSFRIPLVVDYMLPHILWPGQAYDAPRPKGWPEEFPFPLPDPLPFDLVGEAFTMQQEIQNLTKIQELVNNLSEKKEKDAFEKLITRLTEQKLKNLKDLLKEGWVDRSGD